MSVVYAAAAAAAVIDAAAAAAAAVVFVKCSVPGHLIATGHRVGMSTHYDWPVHH